MLNIPIKIGKKTYYIRSDQRNYMFGYNKPSKVNRKGKLGDSFVPYGYYSSLEHMFSVILGLKVRTSTAKTLEELSLEIIKAKRELTGLYDDVFKGE